MKKKYTKPALNVEFFTLTQSIARDCGSSAPVNASNVNDCIWDLGGGNSIFIAIANCTIDGEDMGYGCYNNPGEGNYIFRS